MSYEQVVGDRFFIGVTELAAVAAHERMDGVAKVVAADVQGVLADEDHAARQRSVLQGFDAGADDRRVLAGHGRLPFVLKGRSANLSPGPADLGRGEPRIPADSAGRVVER